MKKSLILHIPHASTFIPNTEGFVVDADTLNLEMLKLTDWYTDDIFYSAADTMIATPFSRIFCDVERFADDTQEPMASYGMGALYQKTCTGETLRIITPELKQQIMTEYYQPHHNRLTEIVQQQLDVFGSALIVDCHSFPDNPFLPFLYQNVEQPDFCIGTDLFHTPQNLINQTIAYFQQAGFSVAINEPYNGTLVPMSYYQSNPNVQSIMIEINRKLYLKENSNEKSEWYEILKSLVNYYLLVLKTW
jgi:N-formylglutamate amidohydrolase